MRIRLIGTPAEVQLALIRLQQAFSEVTATAPRPCRRDGQLVRVYATCKF
ncbi:hypothetical protein ABIA33_003392 [Streptacidiphilus sp. MAP12-16]